MYVVVAYFICYILLLILYRMLIFNLFISCQKLNPGNRLCFVAFDRSRCGLVSIKIQYLLWDGYLCWFVNFMERIRVFLFNLFLNCWRIFLLNWQRTESSPRISSRLYSQIKHIPSSCNVLLCRSALVPAGGCEAPLIKVAAVSLSRSFYLSPFVVYGSFNFHWHACCLN